MAARSNATFRWVISGKAVHCRPTATSKNRVHEKVLKEANGSLKWEASTKAGEISKSTSSNTSG